MKNKIEDVYFATIENGFDYSLLANPTLLQQAQIGGHLKKYILLTQAANLFKDFSPLEIFYNRYYNFMMFQASYLRLYQHDDLNFRQQEFKIIEDGNAIDGVDWAVIEGISNEVNSMP